ncbi:YetF domain-containing protein [Ewingella americana]|uniref:YetF domain-containing protein n=1 Tax=Ewingella americana TaxID=41202 RepID=UPI003D669C82
MTRSYTKKPPLRKPNSCQIKDGRVRYSGLDAIRKDEAWLHDKIAAAGTKNGSDIFLLDSGKSR